MIFIETYKESSKNYNLSEMDKEYQDIISAFQEERFEEVPELINKGYEKLSEIEASQTALKLFYSATSRSIKNFLKKHWLKIIIGVVIITLSLLLSWKTLSRIRIKMRLNHLILQKKSLNNLIKTLQHDYFKTKKISETEYKIKLERFKELIRDIEREIPLLKEEIMKITKLKKASRK